MVGARRARLGVAGIVLAALLLPLAPAAATPVTPTPLAAGATAASALAVLADAAPTASEAEVGEAIADRLLVTFHDDVRTDEAQAVLDAVGVGGEAIPGFSVAIAEVDPDHAAEALVALAAAPEVVAVEPDQLLRFTAAADALQADQWWWRNTGQVTRTQEAGRRNIDIGAQEAWQVSRGRSGVIVAVVDTGMDTSHPDLAPNLWRNPRPGTFPGCAGDLHGCNFSGSGASGDVFASATEDEHGTHVAGVIAAADDGRGTVGVAPRVSLMSVKFLRNQNGAVSDGVLALQYAVAMGADVINASWGVPGTATSSSQHAAIERTIAEARVPIVVAAGNGRPDRCEGLDLGRSPEYPASSEQPNVIVVTAVDNRGALPCFANRSSHLVDVAAPGVDVLSTVPGGGHHVRSGTSQAAPMVSGAVALAISATGVTDGARIADALRRGARPVGHLGDVARPSGATRAGLASAPGLLRALGADVGACRGGAPRAPFADLVRRDVHTANVDCVVHRGLASGYPDGRYRPARTVTRGQVATFLAGLVRTAKDLPVPADRRFVDLHGDVHRDNIEALAAVGVVDGYRDDTYRSADRVTREQFASLLVRTYEMLAGGRIRPVGIAFDDVTGSVHERNVRAAAQLGFVEGRSSERFDPRDGVTRAQLGSLLRRALDKLVNDRVSRL